MCSSAWTEHLPSKQGVAGSNPVTPIIMDILELYQELRARYGPQKWWPRRTGENFEVCIGAILTQNTRWSNVEKALDNLITEDATSPEKIAAMHERKLQRLIRPSGFFRQKSNRLKTFAHFVLSYGSFEHFSERITREELLGINGIGRETADCILLYACGKPFFVVDNYTRQLLLDRGIINGKEDYDEIKILFESRLPRSVSLYKEYHGLIVVDGQKNRAI